MCILENNSYFTRYIKWIYLCERLRVQNKSGRFGHINKHAILGTRILQQNGRICSSFVVSEFLLFDVVSIKWSGGGTPSLSQRHIISVQSLRQSITISIAASIIACPNTSMIASTNSSILHQWLLISLVSLHQSFHRSLNPSLNQSLMARIFTKN